MPTLRDKPEDIQRAIAILKRGGVVAIPTETVYGLAADALNPQACRNIFEIKGRPLIDPLIVHVYAFEQVKKLAVISPEAKRLAKIFWPGPLTLVLPKKPEVPDIVTASQKTVAIRIPGHPLLRKVLRASKLALAAPSANPFGYISPTRPEHVRASLGSRVPYILDGGPCSIGIESTIVDMSTPSQPRILRPGPITQRTIEKRLGIRIKTLSAAGAKTKSSPITPGLMEKHYSPYTSLFLLDPGSPTPSDLPQKSAWVRLSRETQAQNTGADAFWLSESGNLREAARHLFALLRTLDTQGYQAIYLEKMPNRGIGVSINDRLQRAASD